MTVREQDGVRIDDGHGIVTAIDRRTKNAQVSIDADGLKFAVKGWVEIADLNVIEGDQVVYERHKELPDGFPRFAKLARATAGEGEQRDQTAQPPPSGDDAERGEVDRGRGDSATAALRPPPPDGVPNTDTQRFEGYAFLAACGMVDLAYEELNDALEGGELDEIKPALLLDVSRALLNAADQAQRGLVGRCDRSAQSHTRARGVVRTALRKHPVRGGLGDLDAWAGDVSKTTTRLLAMAASL